MINKKRMRLKPLQTLSKICISFFLAGCASGPIVTTCVSNPKANNFICKNPNWKTSINFKPSAVDNWIFLSAADENSALTACSNRTNASVSPCVFSASTLNFACFSEVSGKPFGLTYAQSENWIGVSAIDEQILLQYCASLK